MESEMTELIMQSNALAERFIQLTEENNVLLRENNALMRQLLDQVSIRTKQNQN
jgi:regulator of replication initiation timing